MSKHMPGPWVYESAKVEGYVIRVPESLRYVVDPSDHDGRYGPIYREANARLIAAAPDLLEALQSLTSYVEQLETLVYAQDDAGTHESVENARAAIAKAKGEDNE